MVAMKITWANETERLMLDFAEIKADQKEIMESERENRVPRVRSTSMPVVGSNLNLVELDDQDEEIEFDEEIKRAKRLERRSVKFSPNLLEVGFIPNDSEARTSRIGSWEAAPFNDEIWDGSANDFREHPISTEELAKQNVKYEVWNYCTTKVDQVLYIFGMCLETFSFQRNSVLAKPKQIKESDDSICPDCLEAFLHNFPILRKNMQGT